MHLQFGRLSIIVLLPFFVSVCVSPPRGVIVLCAGDSITAEAYPHFLERMLNADGIRARVRNYGRSGFRSEEYLNFLGRQAETMKAWRPDFILLQLGTNDVRTDLDFTATDVFQKNMRSILSVFRTFKDRMNRPSRILIALIPPVPAASSYPFSAESRRRVIEEINPALRSLAAAENLVLVDNFGIFDGRPDILPEVHPTREGYRILAANWHASLKPFLRGRK